MKFETNNTILALCCKFYIYNLKKKIYILYNHNNIVLLSFFLTIFQQSSIYIKIKIMS